MPQSDRRYSSSVGAANDGDALLVGLGLLYQLRVGGLLFLHTESGEFRIIKAICRKQNIQVFRAVYSI